MTKRHSRFNVSSFKPGVRVQTEDGEAYRLETIILDPVNFQPSHLVVRHENNGSGEVKVPVELITEISQEAIQLGLPEEFLSGFPKYSEA